MDSPDLGGSASSCWLCGVPTPGYESLGRSISARGLATIQVLYYALHDIVNFLSRRIFYSKIQNSKFCTKLGAAASLENRSCCSCVLRKPFCNFTDTLCSAKFNHAVISTNELVTPQRATSLDATVMVRRFLVDLTVPTHAPPPISNATSSSKLHWHADCSRGRCPVRGAQGAQIRFMLQSNLNAGKNAAS